MYESRVCDDAPGIFTLPTVGERGRGVCAGTSPGQRETK